MPNDDEPTNKTSAEQWRRAAVVAAYVGPTYTPEEFAALGVPGLRSATTVRRYRDAWISVRGSAPLPGEVVNLPDEEFPNLGDGGTEPQS